MFVYLSSGADEFPGMAAIRDVAGIALQPLSPPAPPFSQSPHPSQQLWDSLRAESATSSKSAFPICTLMGKHCISFSGWAVKRGLRVVGFISAATLLASYNQGIWVFCFFLKVGRFGDC